VSLSLPKILNNPTWGSNLDFRGGKPLPHPVMFLCLLRDVKGKVLNNKNNNNNNNTTFRFQSRSEMMGQTVQCFLQYTDFRGLTQGIRSSDYYSCLLRCDAM
jgi:hypothetical protein